MCACVCMSVLLWLCAYVCQWLRLLFASGCVSVLVPCVCGSVGIDASASLCKCLFVFVCVGMCTYEVLVCVYVCVSVLACVCACQRLFLCEYLS